MYEKELEKFFVNEEYPQEKKRQKEFVNKLINELGLSKQIKKAVSLFGKMIKEEPNNYKIIHEFLPFLLATSVKSAVEKSRSEELLKEGFSKDDLPKILKASDEELKNIIYYYNEQSWALFYYRDLSLEARLTFKDSITKQIEQRTEYDVSRVRSIIRKYDSPEMKEKLLNDLIWIPTILEEASRSFYEHGKHLREKRDLEKTDPELFSIRKTIIQLKKYLPKRPWTNKKLLVFFEKLHNGKKYPENSFNEWKRNNRAKVESIKKKFTKKQFNELIKKYQIDPLRIPPHLL